MFTGKKILIGISGGIAAYKTCYLIRSIRKQGGEVRVILTSAGEKFITPVTLEGLANQPVATDTFDSSVYGPFPHIDLPKWADCFLVAPATSNILAKTAHGISDDLLSTAITAHKERVIFAPAMNDGMWDNPATQKNLEQIREFGHKIILPGSGDLACETVGTGRMAEPDEMESELKRFLGLSEELKGRKILVTAGGTREPIDPVRYIGNRSSGKMGKAIAETARSMGAEVILIMGPNSVHSPEGISIINVTTAAKMADAVNAEVDAADALIMAAAVADFRPAVASSSKIKKDGKTALTLELEKTEDILGSLAKRYARKKNRPVIAGFALETENESENAKKKLDKKGLDLIVMNNPLVPGAGFEVDTNRITIIERVKRSKKLPLMSKHEAARHILNRISALLK